MIIIFNLLSGWRMDSFPLDIKRVLLMLHSGVGSTIFLVMLFRWWWRKAHNLYAPPRWWKRPSMLLQWVFYPLLLMQAVIGVTLAAFIDYDVIAFGLIPYSAIAADSESLHALFLDVHGIMAWVLIALVVVHGVDKAYAIPSPSRRTSGNWVLDPVPLIRSRAERDQKDQEMAA